eukprot:3765477-Amphidinium_carterae.1
MPGSPAERNAFKLSVLLAGVLTSSRCGTLALKRSTSGYVAPLRSGILLDSQRKGTLFLRIKPLRQNWRLGANSGDLETLLSPTRPPLSPPGVPEN